MRANRNIEQTKMHSESEGNSGVEPVAGPKKLNRLIDGAVDKYKKWKMRNPYDVSGKLGSDQMGGG